MDPLTALSLATAAFTGVKKVVQAGKDAEDIYKQLSKWAGHVSDLNNFINEKDEDDKPKKLGIFEKIGFAKNETSEAFDQIIAKRKVKEMEDEIRHMFTWGELHHLGLDGYRDFIKRRRKIKEDREKLIWDQRRRKRKFIKMCRDITVISIVLLLSVWLIWWMIDIILSAPAFQNVENINGKITD
tara:strand:+ start:3053 stop:3607 length:555 start_codon:yes stop_codon:yes gene_type:complete